MYSSCTDCLLSFNRSNTPALVSDCVCYCHLWLLPVLTCLCFTPCQRKQVWFWLFLWWFWSFDSASDPPVQPSLWLCTSALFWICVSLDCWIWIPLSPCMTELCISWTEWFWIWILDICFLTVCADCLFCFIMCTVCCFLTQWSCSGWRHRRVISCLQTPFTILCYLQHTPPHITGYQFPGFILASISIPNVSIVTCYYYCSWNSPDTQTHPVLFLRYRSCSSYWSGVEVGRWSISTVPCHWSVRNVFLSSYLYTVYQLVSQSWTAKLISKMFPNYSTMHPRT